MKLSLAVVSLVAVVGLTTAPAFSEGWTHSESEKPLAFNDVNELLHRNYAKAKDEIRQKLGPIVLCSGSSITLIKNNERDTAEIIKPHYTGLKQVAHITLGTFVLLTNHTDEDLSPEKITQLEDYKSGIEKAAGQLKTNEGLLPEDDPRQEQLITKTLAFLTKVIGDKRVSHNDLHNFVRDTSVPDLENAYDAAGSQITAMDNAMTKWRKQMTNDEWNNLNVLILTTHMPRQDLLAFQFFCKLLDQKREGDRIIVAESAGTTTEEQAIDLLLIHRLDKKIAVEFFDDPWRMHRDLLSDAAKEWLDKHKLEAAELEADKK